MGERSGIEWTDHTFNPWVGCTKISRACDHCFAEGWARRSGHVQWGGERKRTTTTYWQQPIKWNRAAEAAGVRPKVFCASLADVFDNQVPAEWRVDLWALIASTPHLDWLLLTKRPQNIGKMLPGSHVEQLVERDLPPWPWPNVWLGTTAENQQEADRRIPHLLAAPAVVRFLSVEPLLGPVDLRATADDALDDLCGDRPALDWIIVGGESGAQARPMHPDWVRSLRDQCAAAGTAFFMKQWGEFREFDTGSPAVDVVEADADFETAPNPAALGAIRPSFVALDGRHFQQFGEVPEGLPVRLIERVGKKAAGRLLDGVLHDAMPPPVFDGGRS
ncbi:phage Gp37/Gp68 family protein [Azospirillum sp. ST 5-10]|uniref:phage Gp37/Gp68 family protein n=1 Tax=unclassified Azospirillum TaxID=2630922 RepID=UPI003F4A5F4F